MRTIGPLCLALIGLAASPAVSQLEIDDFEVGEFMHMVPPDNLFQSGLPTANVLGGARRVFLRGADQTATLTLTPGDDAVVFAQTVSGDFFIEWDLADMPFDLTAGGTLDRIEVDVETISETIELFVHACCQVSVVSQPITGPGTYVFSYADLSGPATDVDYLQISASFTGQLGGTLAIADVRAMPEPVAPDRFVPGDVFWVATAPQGNVVNISGGGDFAGVTPLQSVGSSIGQVAWSADLSTAYITEITNDAVAFLLPDGSAGGFAVNLASPSGIVRTSDGRLLVASFDDRAVYDITGGGSFASAIPFATGFSDPRNLAELPSGEILLADQGLNAVIDIAAGGDLTGVEPFASGVDDVVDLTLDDSGRLWAAARTRGVIEITGGGDFSLAIPHATGREFIALAFDGSGRLLATDLTSDDIFDVTAGGDFSTAMPFAFNLPGESDAALDTVPVPEPSFDWMRLVAIATLGVMSSPIRRVFRASTKSSSDQ